MSSYGHAARIASLPSCRDCHNHPALTVSDIDGRPLCAGCNLTETKG